MKKLAWILVLFLSACATTISRPPAVSLAGVDIESIGLFEQRYILKLRVKNPNDVDIPVEALDFAVDLNGRHFADGISRVGVIIPRQGEALVDVKATSNLASFLRQWKEQEREGRSGLEYRVKGNLRISGRGSMPFDHRGETPIPFLFDDKPAPRPAPKASQPGEV